jgi:hypothetical protein
MALLLVFAGWTLFVWGTRISNILSDGGGAAALLVATGLVALGLAVALHAFTRRLAWSVPALVAGTVAVWAVRVPGVLLHDHSTGFKAVHLALGVVSVLLALAALRATREPVAA